MPVTYSISVGTSIESYRKLDINSVLVDLPDNTQKLISPKDVRDAFLSTWANSAFKQTTTTGEYIGIDSGDPSNRDIKQKILLGKRSFGGSDVMITSLLTGDTDIFFYNTKSDILSQNTTKISILSGTDSNLHNNAPYIQSKSYGTFSSLDFINPLGPINVYSQTGRISINGILFPSIYETAASASNGKILRYSGTYPNGILKWSDMTFTTTTIGDIGGTTSIYGNPVNLNGYSLEFVESSIVPKTIGGILIGSSFSSGSFNSQNWPLSEVIRKLIYPYVPPTLTLSVTNSTNSIYAEVGLTSSGTFSYSLTRYSNNINSFQITGTSPLQSGSFISTVGSYTYSTFTQSLYKSTSGTQSYILEASDSGNPGFSYSATSSIEFVYPFYYGFTGSNLNMSTINSSQVISLIGSTSKLIVGKSNITVYYNGSGYICLLLPGNYGTFSSISTISGINPTQYLQLDVTSSFTYSNQVSVVGYFPGLPSFRLYKSILPCSYSGNIKFEF